MLMLERTMKCEAKLGTDAGGQEQSPFWREIISEISYIPHVQKIAGYFMCTPSTQALHNTSFTVTAPPSTSSPLFDHRS
jgi:hypothetical protein